MGKSKGGRLTEGVNQNGELKRDSYSKALWINTVESEWTLKNHLMGGSLGCMEFLRSGAFASPLPASIPRINL